MRCGVRCLYVYEVCCVLRRATLTADAKPPVFVFFSARRHRPREHSSTVAATNVGTMLTFSAPGLPGWCTRNLAHWVLCAVRSRDWEPSQPRIYPPIFFSLVKYVKPQNVVALPLVEEPLALSLTVQGIHPSAAHGLLREFAYRVSKAKFFPCVPLPLLLNIPLLM